MKGIGRQTDYATRIVLHLAGLGDDVQVPMKEVAAKKLLPPAFVRRIVARLAGAGILRTSRGGGGGIKLARPAAEISLLDVVNAIEGGIVFNRCVNDPPDCPLSATCPVQCAWAGATRHVEDYLAGVRFDRLAKGRRSS